MKKKRENEKCEESNKVKTSLISSLHTVKEVMLAHSKLNTAYPIRYFPSLSSLFVDNSKYLKYLLEKFGDIFQNPYEGLHLLRGIPHQIHFILKYSQQKPLVIPKSFKRSMHKSLIHLTHL